MLFKHYAGGLMWFVVIVRNMLVSFTVLCCSFLGQYENISSICSESNQFTENRMRRYGRQQVCTKPLAINVFYKVHFNLNGFLNEHSSTPSSNSWNGCHTLTNERLCCKPIWSLMLVSLSLSFSSQYTEALGAFLEWL